MCLLLTEIDLLTLEGALRVVSRGTMSAPLDRVLNYATSQWAYPGSGAQAEAILASCGRYEIVHCPETPDRIVRPVSLAEAALSASSVT